MEKEKLKKDMEQLVEEHGEPFSTKLYQEEGAHSIATIFRNFGSWKNARESIGLSRKTPRDYSDYRTDNEVILEDIIQASNNVDGKLTKRNYNELGNFNPSTIRDRFGSWNKGKQEAGLETANRKDYLSKYSVDEDFFKDLKPESAYVLGLYLADGHVSGNTFGIKLKDKDVVKKVKEVISTDAPVKCRYGKYWRIRIHNQDFVQPLKEMNVVDNKTYDMKIPPSLDNKLYKHFYRGYFDGDGTIGIYDGSKYIIGNCCIVKSFMEKIQTMNSKYFGTKNNLSINFSGTTYRFSYQSKEDIAKLYSMYEGADNLYMKRKKNIFDEAYKWASS